MCAWRVSAGALLSDTRALTKLHGGSWRLHVDDPSACHEERVQGQAPVPREGSGSPDLHDPHTTLWSHSDKHLLVISSRLPKDTPV